MLNQFCALAWNQANLFDLKVLFEFLEGSEQLAGFDFRSLGREETIILLGLIFFTSNPFERILSFPVFPTVEPRINSPEGFYNTENSIPKVRLYSPGPDLTDRTLS